MRVMNTCCGQQRGCSGAPAYQSQVFPHFIALQQSSLYSRRDILQQQMQWAFPLCGYLFKKKNSWMRAGELFS